MSSAPEELRPSDPLAPGNQWGLRPHSPITCGPPGEVLDPPLSMCVCVYVSMRLYMFRPTCVCIYVRIYVYIVSSFYIHGILMPMSVMTVIYYSTSISAKHYFH